MNTIAAEALLIDTASIIEVSGRHAVRYLNNRLTNDIKRFMDRAPAQAVAETSDLPNLRAAALSAQGRVEGLFTLLLGVQRPVGSATPGGILLVCDSGAGSEEFVESLGRYKVADDVHFTVCAELTLVHSSSPDVFSVGCASWDRSRGIPNGRDVLVPREKVSELSFISQEQATFRRLVSGEPQFGVDFDSDVLLAESGFSDAVSFTKGCYVGQEVVARIDALGKPPRVMVRCKVVGGDPIGGEPVGGVEITTTDTGKRVGELTTSIVRDGNVLAFALLRNDEGVLSSAKLAVHGRSLEIIERLA